MANDQERRPLDTEDVFGEAFFASTMAKLVLDLMIARGIVSKEAVAKIVDGVILTMEEKHLDPRNPSARAANYARSRLEALLANYSPKPSTPGDGGDEGEARATS